MPLVVQPAHEDVPPAQSADVVELVPNPPPRAADFWEGAAIQDALQAPVLDPSGHVPRVSDQGTRMSDQGPRMRAAERLSRLRARPFVAVSGVGFACLALLVATWSAQPAARRATPGQVAERTNVKGGAAPLGAGIATLLAGIRLGHPEGLGGIGSQHPGDGQRRARAAQPGASRAPRRSALAKPRPGHLVPSAGQAAGSAAVPVVDSQSTAAGAGAGSAGSGPAGSSSGSVGGGAPAGPVGPGAPFGPGHLG